MKFQHNFITGKTCSIEPLYDKNFPRHGAFLTIRQEGKREPIYMKMLTSFSEGITYCKHYGYEVPIGIY